MYGPDTQQNASGDVVRLVARYESYSAVLSGTAVTNLRIANPRVSVTTDGIIMFDFLAVGSGHSVRPCLYVIFHGEESFMTIRSRRCASLGSDRVSNQR